MSASLSFKEPWQIDFENEPINDDRWTCLVTALVESKVSRQNPWKILLNFTHGNHVNIAKLKKYYYYYYYYHYAAIKTWVSFRFEI